MKHKILNILGVIAGTVGGFYTFGVVGGMDGGSFTPGQAWPRIIVGIVVTLVGIALANYNNNEYKED